jgi:hypothetical protein
MLIKDSGAWIQIKWSHVAGKRTQNIAIRKRLWLLWSVFHWMTTRHRVRTWLKCLDLKKNIEIFKGAHHCLGINATNRLYGRCSTSLIAQKQQKYYME